MKLQVCLVPPAPWRLSVKSWLSCLVSRLPRVAGCTSLVLRSASAGSFGIPLKVCRTARFRCAWRILGVSSPKLLTRLRLPSVLPRWMLRLLALSKVRGYGRSSLQSLTFLGGSLRIPSEVRRFPSSPVPWCPFPWCLNVPSWRCLRLSCRSSIPRASWLLLPTVRLRSCTAPAPCLAARRSLKVRILSWLPLFRC